MKQFGPTQSTPLEKDKQLLSTPFAEQVIIGSISPLFCLILVEGQNNSDDVNDPLFMPYNVLKCSGSQILQIETATDLPQGSTLAFDLRVHNSPSLPNNYTLLTLLTSSSNDTVFSLTYSQAQEKVYLQLKDPSSPSSFPAYAE